MTARRAVGTVANAEAYRQAWRLFWASLDELEAIVRGDFPNAEAAGVAPTRYQVDALRDLGNRLAALVEGYETAPPF